MFYLFCSYSCNCSCEMPSRFNSASARRSTTLTMLVSVSAAITRNFFSVVSHRRVVRYFPMHVFYHIYYIPSNPILPRRSDGGYLRPISVYWTEPTHYSVYQDDLITT